MRPLRRRAGRSCTTTLPIRNRARLTVSAGSAERRRRRIVKFTGEDFGAAHDEDMDVESAGEQFLEVVGRNEILIFRMLSNKTGDVRTERDNAEMIEAGENERNAPEGGSPTPALDRKSTRLNSTHT